MKLLRSLGMLGTALALVAVAASEAAAQAPVLTVSANGSVVTIDYTTVPGATGYNIQAGTGTGLANIASVNLPATITRIVVTAPGGLYFLRVRATAGGVNGPFSNEVSVNVGGAAAPGPCVAPAAPVATANVAGGFVTINWNATAGATSHSVQFSRFPGGTELAQNAAGTATSHGQYVGLVGTFFARVVAVTPCGNATSAEIPFTITDLTSGGPRTPDPPPGQLLPRPTYGQAVVIAVANAYRGDLLNSCVEHGGTNIFMFRVLSELRKRDSRWGLNIKRGNQGLSQDILTYNPTAGPDSTAIQIYLWDMIGGHCGNSPSWNWQDVTDATWAGGQAGLCSNAYCARWTIDPYFRAGFQP